MAKKAIKELHSVATFYLLSILVKQYAAMATYYIYSNKKQTVYCAMFVIATVKGFPLVRENTGIHNCIHKTNAFRRIPVCRALFIYGFIS